MWLSRTMYLTILLLHLASIALCSSPRSLLNTTATTTTPSPPAYCSSAHQFYCHLSDKCIPAAHRCDGNPNCNGNEDEQGCIPCTNVTASQMNMFYCESSKKCISIEWKCDGADDCGDNEDELSYICENGKRRCKSGQCIDEDWWCDTQVDCTDGTDEESCTQQCANNQIKCSANGTEHEHCISSVWRCDGAIDCPNGEDEANCTARSCPVAHFMCAKEGRCIPERWRCDNDSDCEDGEDEKSCGVSNARHPQVNTCTQLEFACASGAVSCILKGWQCDGAEDCSDGSDEHGCGGTSAIKCRPGQFQCTTSHECIPSLLLCSGKAECADGSDEMHPSCADTKRYCNLTAGEFSCVEDFFGSTCVTLDQVCDGSNDCPSLRDESDEFCSRNAPGTLCIKDTCGHTARCVDVLNSKNTSVGTDCKCPSGYYYNKRVKECQDINECSESGTGKLPVCDQVCVNTNGSYKCECELNYYLQGDGRSCKTAGVIPKLLFTNRHQIQSLHMHKADIYVSLIDSKAAVAIDFDYEKKTVFFSDMMQKKIFQFKMPSEEHEEDLHSVDLNISGIQTPDGLAYDWVYEHLYWTDTASNTINMACLGNGSDVSGQRMTTVLYGNEDPSCVQRNSSSGPDDICIDEPRALVLYPHKGWMFWSDWGQNPNIIKAAIDGSHKEKLVYNTENKLLLVWPNGLTLDISASGSERLYWIDAKLFSVFSCSLKNCMNDAYVLAYDTDNIKHPFSITVFENQLFWSDWHHQRIVSANKFTGRNVSHILTRLEQPMDLKVFHPVSQPKGQNLCGLVAAEDKCQHICVPKPWHKEAGSFVPVVGVKHTCLCANGFRLAEDGRSCISVQTEKPKMNNNHNYSAVAVKESHVSEAGLSVGVIAGIASSAVFLTGAAVFSILFIVLRRIRSNKSKSMNFDNPIYKRTTEDKLELPRHEYQPSQTIPAAMVPLTAEESTEMSHDDYDV